MNDIIELLKKDLEEDQIYTDVSYDYDRDYFTESDPESDHAKYEPIATAPTRATPPDLPDVPYINSDDLNGIVHHRKHDHALQKGNREEVKEIIL